jgi:hypothetical protein
VADTPWGRDLYKNLGDLLDRGGRCVVLPGNHDPEVAHPSFREDLLAKAGKPPNHPGLTVHTRGPWRTNIGPREIVVGHGHRHDPWNDIHPDTVEAALQGQPAALPPGSRLVTEVLNAFKNARDERGALRFPFVDLLKPEVPAVPLLLLYLDHDRAMKHLLPALDVGVDALTEKLAKALLGSDTLGPGTAAPTTSPAHDIARALAVTYTATERGQRRRRGDPGRARRNSAPAPPRLFAKRLGRGAILQSRAPERRRSRNRTTAPPAERSAARRHRGAHARRTRGVAQ